MVWTKLRAQLTEAAASSKDVRELMFLALRGELADTHPLREPIMALSWITFRIAMEARPTARVQIPLRLTAIDQENATIGDLLSDLEAFELGDSNELDELAFGDTQSILRELKEAQSRALFTNRQPILGQLFKISETTDVPILSLGFGESKRLTEAQSLVATSPNRALTVALECGQDESESATNRAAAYRLAGRIVEANNEALAMAHYRTSLQLAYSSETEVYLAALISDGGAPETAEEMTLHALGQGHPRLETAYTILGYVYRALGRHREAERAFGHSLIYTPTLEDSRAGRCQARLQLGDFDGAARDAEKMIEHGNDRGYQTLAHVEHKRGNLDAALEAVNHHLRIDRTNQAYMARAVILYSRGDYSASEDDCDRVLEDIPNSTYALLLRLKIRLDQNEWVGASGDLRQLLEEWDPAEEAINSGLIPSLPFATREEALTCRSVLLSHLLPEDTALDVPRSLFRAGDEIEGFRKLHALIVGDDRDARRAATSAAMPLLRAVGNDDALQDVLRPLRMAL